MKLHRKSHPLAGKLHRRTFLKAAGAAVVAFPFIKPSSARATDPNSPNPWMMRGCNGRIENVDCHNMSDDPVQGYVGDNIPITGIRHYCAMYTVPTVWPSIGETIPNKADVSLCVTLYPNYDQLLSGGYDSALAAFLGSGQSQTQNGFNGGRAMLSLWHECSNHPDTSRCPSLDPNSQGKADGNCVQLTSARIKAMQTYVYNFVKTGNGNQTPTSSQRSNPLYNIAFGAVDIGGWAARAGAFMAPGLDFYGIDLYHADDADPVARLNEWFYHAVTTGYGAPGCTVSVCECNCSDDSQRAAYFSKTANWVWNQQNKGARSFLTFWNGSGGMGGPYFQHSADCADMPGDWCGQANAGTKNCLRDIGNQKYGTYGT